MCQALATAFCGFIFLVGGGSAVEHGVDLRLICEPAASGLSTAVLCDVTVRNLNAYPVIVPKVPTPFPIPHLEPTLLYFEVRTGSSWHQLQIASSAKRGRYDLGNLTRDSLLVLRGSGIYGWRFDIDGNDWTLPAKPGNYEIRARLVVQLLPRDPSGRLARPLKELLGSRAGEAKKYVLDGEFISNVVTVEKR